MTNTSCFGLDDVEFMDFFTEHNVSVNVWPTEDDGHEDRGVEKDDG